MTVINTAASAAAERVPRLNKRSQLRHYERAMRDAGSYAEWRDAAIAHDALTGLKRWRDVDHSGQYDYVQIRLRLDRLRALRSRHDYHGLLFTLNEGIHGNMAGMGRSSLYRKSKFGTKRLIEEYVEEIDDSLRFLAELDSKHISLAEKLDFFYRANLCFGRSALMLSGGGVLGFYHLGVVKVLLDQQLLPRVISGSSAGSLIAAVIATHSETELQQFFDSRNVHFEAEREATVLSRMFFGKQPQIDERELTGIITRLIPDLTFQEAYEKTSRQISISVAPAEPHQRSRLLNAITSPNVYIRSAVMASCAVPGVFPPVMLMAKNVHGEAQPYLPSRRWVDGSIASDLPSKRLSRLFGTNHYIVSMVNPLAIPFLNQGRQRSRLLSAVGGLGVGMGREALNFYRGIVQKEGEHWPRLNLALNSVHSVLDQDYSGDINIVPNFGWYNPAKLLAHISEQELIALMQAGERASYPHIESIRTCTQISRTLDQILYRFEHGDLSLPTGDARPRAARRRGPPMTGAPQAAAAASKGTGKVRSSQQKTATTSGRVTAQGAVKATPAKPPSSRPAETRRRRVGTGSKSPGD